MLFFRARNGTFKRVPIKGNSGFESSAGGMTVYYIPVLTGTKKITAFKKGFRMIVGTDTHISPPSTSNMHIYNTIMKMADVVLFKETQVTERKPKRSSSAN